MTTKGIPSVPDVPTKFNDFDLYRILEPLKRIIDIRQGQFDPADRWITQQDLVDLGLQNEATIGTPVVVVPPVNVFTFNLIGVIEGGPTQMADGTNPINMSTIINLPNVVCIDGGNAASTYPQDPNGPYGVVQSPSNFITESNGVQLSTATAKYNWVGFNIVETSPDNFDITFGAQADLSVYCPNYPYTFVNIAAWDIIGFDVTNLFTQSRRCRFIDGASEYFGNVLTASYNGTKTSLTMDMDPGDDLTASVSEVCLITDGTGWTPIASDPFGGTPINDICSGFIGGTKYWIACGNAGRVRYSTDAGVTWTSSVSGTTQNLNQIDYNPDSETFLIGGNGGVILRSTDGTSWTANTTSVPALSTGNADITGIGYDLNNTNNWIIYFNNAPTVRGTAFSADDGLTWANADTSVSSTSLARSKIWKRFTASGFVGFLMSVGEDVYIASTANDNTVSVIYNTSGQPAATDGDSYYYGIGASTLDMICKGAQINNGTTELDDIQWGSSIINGCAWSPTHNRLVMVGEDGKIGTYEAQQVDDSWNDYTLFQSNGGNPLADYLCVHWDEDDGVFIAGNNQGQIVRSTNGLGALPDLITFTGWTLIAADPFSGGRINKILSGAIGATEWWVAIGQAGALYTSTDAGLTWTARTSGVTSNLISIGYNRDDEQFLIGCDNGDYLHSTNGTTWTADTTTIAALGGTGTNRINCIEWDVNSLDWWIGLRWATANSRTYYADSAFTAWTLADSSVAISETCNARTKYPPSDNDIIFAVRTVDDTGYYTAASDTTDSTFLQSSAGFEISGLGVGQGTTSPQGVAFTTNFLQGNTNGEIKRGGATTGAATVRGLLNNSVMEPMSAANRAVRGIAFSSVSNRWVITCDVGEIYTIANADFDEPHYAFAQVANPFVGDITDVYYNANDDIFIAVSSIGEIGRSTDGIS